MKKLILKILAAVVLAIGFVSAGINGSWVSVGGDSVNNGAAFAGLEATPVYAAQCGDVETSIIDCSGTDTSNGGGIFVVINIVLNVLTFGVGIAGTLGIVISGIMYLTARDNEAQMTKAKSRLINIAIGLAAYAVMWAFLQWLLPGGIFGN